MLCFCIDYFLSLELKEEVDNYRGSDPEDYGDFMLNKPLEEVKKRRENQGDSSSSSTQVSELIDNEVILADRRGPVHTMLKLGYHDKMHDIYKHTQDVVSKFLFLVLPEAVGKRKWNKLAKGLKPSQFVSCSDEAFAMIMIENNGAKWLDLLMNPSLSVSERRKLKTKYTQRDDQVGWSNEGIYRFTQLTKIVALQRKQDQDRIDMIDTLCTRKFQRNKLHKSDKRKLDEFMKSMNQQGYNLEERMRVEKEQRRKNEEMNDILLNMCMQGSECDLLVIGDPIPL